jgi:hypothetical protein
VAPTQTRLGAHFAVWRVEAARRAGGSGLGVECSDPDRAVANGIGRSKTALHRLLVKRSRSSSSRRACKLFQVRIGWLSALRIHLQSMFYLFALPMTIGLEIARFIKIRQIEPAANSPPRRS